MSGQRLQKFRLMTYNIGGRRDLDSQPDAISQVIGHLSPDIVAIQEAADYQDADGTWKSPMGEVAQDSGSEYHVHFAPSLSMREHMDVRQRMFVHGLFNDWQDWRLGNALLSRWEFVRLGDPSQPGTPRNVPIFRTHLYEGDRDTEPRNALVSRIGAPLLSPFVVGVHLTTLVGERDRVGGPHPQPDRVEVAWALRVQQAERILALLREHVTARGEVVFLLGDFNAAASEPCISSVLLGEGGFERLSPVSDSGATHRGIGEPIDHIFVYPGDRLVGYRCWIADTPLARQTSDHLPVVADVTIAP